MPVDLVTPTACLVVPDSALQRVLLVRTAEGLQLPGAIYVPSETMVSTALRGLEAAAGVRARVSALVGMWTEPPAFLLCFEGELLGGVEAEAAAERRNGVWVPVAWIDEAGPIHEASRERLLVWKGGAWPYMG